MSEITKDTWKLGEHEFSSRFILGSGKYSLELIDAAVKEAKAEIVTMALRRANEGGVANIFQIHQGRAMRRRQFVLQDCQDRSAEVIL